MVRNAAVKSEKNTRTIKTEVQPSIRSRNHRTFMEIIGGKPSIQMTGLGSRFQYEEKISMLAEALKEYTLESAEAAYVYPGEHEPMVFMAS